MTRELADQLRVFVRDRAGRPAYLTMTSFIEAAIQHHMRAIDEQLANAERGRNRLLGENEHARKP